MGAFGRLQWYVQILIVVAVVGGLGFLVWNQVLQPISIDNETKARQKADLQIKVEKMVQLKAKYEQFKKESAALETQLEELKKVLPQDKEIEHILSQVQQAARNSGLRIQQGVSKPVVDHDIYSEWPMEMQVTGTYHNLGAFLENIRQLPRIVNVGKLRVDSRTGPETEDGIANSIAATYEATTFVYREPEAPAAETAKAKTAETAKAKK
jgi:type IV pilus assembly protein PilO